MKYVLDIKENVKEIIKADNNEIDLLPALKKINFSRKRILSFGCGNCRWENWIRYLYPSCHITGIDINEEIIEKTKARCPDIELITGNCFSLTEDFIKNFDFILWIPGPDVPAFFTFLAEYFLYLKKYKITVLLGPYLLDFSRLLSNRYLKACEKLNLKLDEYNFTQTMNNSIKRLAMIQSFEEYKTFIEIIAGTLCKIDKLDGFLVLTDFENKDLEEHLKSQNEFIDFVNSQDISLNQQN